MITNESNHNKLLLKSNNGLVSYNSFHRCVNGILQLMELHVDQDFNTRSFKPIDFEASGLKYGQNQPFLPTPKVKQEEIKIIRIPALPSSADLNVIINDNMLQTSIMIGDIKEDEIKITTIASDQGSILITYYPSEVPYTTAMEKWLTFLANSIEGYLASKLGLLVEVFEYIIDRKDTHPTDFDMKIVRTIFSSIEVYFEPLRELTEDLKDYLSSKYTVGKTATFESLLNFMDKNPEMSLIQYMTYYDGTFHDLISIFFVMELEELIVIHRPGIIEFY